MNKKTRIDKNNIKKISKNFEGRKVIWEKQKQNKKENKV